ncbi:ERG4/ERG24 ergosterol biosynthesis protein [Aulographum hederae CBS 113979]|uniref:7-dehydrocholesterol reductase n=1 Tax=Aulographum hederae CBS 113979 TaxID=1176131 RepID=A0A6G1GZM2_9PEZI|nr:ERG4/ERG24 ergosterol biosynthesis protein [Aulographum hederae CBS 113979]
MFTVPPFATVACWITLEHFDGSFLNMARAMYEMGFLQFLAQFGPSPSPPLQVVGGYAVWVLFQAALYTILPGKSKGQLTPAGNLLEYWTNGLLALVCTIILASGLHFYKVVDLGLVAENWEGLLVTFNMYGLALTVVAFLKAHYAPSHSADRKFSGSMMYDILMGIELNPRFSTNWDWKLFHNGRPGIIGWVLINASFTIAQYRRFGHVTNSIIIVDILQALYIVDFFVNESWYTRTIDIALDHFGFYLAWGSGAFLPTMYTLQAQYLSRHDVQLPSAVAALVLAVGLGGYALFRSVNEQKDLARRTKGDCKIWGKKPNFKRCTFTTTDGQKHESLLLLSGWWGLARHANYTGDLLISYAMCAACGMGNFLPWTYAVIMTSVLVHRCYRDEQSCRAKYGTQWDEYCAQVPWRLVPGVW